MCTFQNQSIKFNTTVLHVYIWRSSQKEENFLNLIYTTSNRENCNQATQSLYIFSFLSSKSNAFFPIKA